jgi:membrane-associated phospholipid phosphatase
LRATYVAVAFFSVVTSRVARLAAVLFVALIAVTAVYSGGHYSEEIIGGVLLGWAMATAARALAGDLTRTPVGPRVNDGARAGIDAPRVVDITDGSAGQSRPEAVPPSQSM